MKATAEQRRQLYPCHVGVGVLIIKTAPNTIMSVDVCTHPQTGALMRIADGRPVFPIACWDEDDNGTVFDLPCLGVAEREEATR